MYSMRRKALSQNFFHSRKLVEKLVRLSSIGQNDVVLEIGPGKGIITKELVYRAQAVIAVEIDPSLYSHLKTQFAAWPQRLTLINKDFLNYNLPRHSYKVFANIPFSIEGKIVRKLLNAINPPKDCYLVIRKDLAERLVGKKKEGYFSSLYKPWFTFQILYYLKKFDFEPAATMDTVLLHFQKREASMLDYNLMKKYSFFLTQAYGTGKTIKHNLRLLLSYEQMKRLSKKYGFRIDARPTDIKSEQWVGIFQFLLSTGKI